MKKLMCFLVLAMTFYSSVTAEEIDIPHIAVFGTAITEITPDKMIWYLNASNKALELDKTAFDHSVIIKEVLGFLKEMNIPQDNIQTSRMNFGENWVYRNKSRVKEGYEANTFISFTVEDLNIYNELWMGLSKISGISIASISYDSSKRIDTQNSTRKKALLSAKEKAETLADTLSAKLGEILIIEEDLSTERKYLNIMTQSRSTEGGDESNDTLALGKIPITQRVKVVFRLISKNSSN
jgi:uncharacterized protein YggE